MPTRDAPQPCKVPRPRPQLLPVPGAELCGSAGGGGVQHEWDLHVRLPAFGTRGRLLQRFQGVVFQQLEVWVQEGARSARQRQACTDEGPAGSENT